jgi:hypothetical protein
MGVAEYYVKGGSNTVETFSVQPAFRCQNVVKIRRLDLDFVEVPAPNDAVGKVFLHDVLGSIVNVEVMQKAPVEVMLRLNIAMSTKMQREAGGTHLDIPHDLKPVITIQSRCLLYLIVIPNQIYSVFWVGKKRPVFVNIPRLGGKIAKPSIFYVRIIFLHLCLR